MKKNILITGSTDGIGKSAALRLAKDGHHIYLHGRNESKLNAVISELKSESGNEHIDGFLADFSDLAAVKKMAEVVKGSMDQLDVLINNAGVWNSQQRTNERGLDMRFVVNYLSPYALTVELLPLLKKSKSPRIINLSSAAQSSVSLAALKRELPISTQEAYAQSKLALTMWSFDLAGREKDLTIIAVNPGSLLNTKMVQEAFGRHFAEVDKGSDILYELALDEKHSSMTGHYFDNDTGGYGRAHADAYNREVVLKLIETTDGLVK
ncbi:MAG: SDR family NAD(P)-dependent oxidoreductase [Flavobacteriales bacterium]|nr:SDR family NAD(P)-dependent oxidoreductase [Flavobacteriales bacterium]